VQGIRRANDEESDDNRDRDEDAAPTVPQRIPPDAALARGHTWTAVGATSKALGGKPRGEQAGRARPVVRLGKRATPSVELMDYADQLEL